MVGWHNRLDGHKFERTPGVGDGRGSLARCGSWGHKESDMTERLKTTTTFNWARLSSRSISAPFHTSPVQEVPPWMS